MHLSFLKKKKRNGIMAMVLPKQVNLFLAIVAMPLPKMGGEKKIEVAEIWGVI